MTLSYGVCAGATRLEALLGRLRSLTQGAGASAASAAAAAAAAAAVAVAPQSGTLGPAIVGLAMIVGVALGVPRLIRWRYPATAGSLQVAVAALTPSVSRLGLGLCNTSCATLCSFPRGPVQI